MDCGWYLVQFQLINWFSTVSFNLHFTSTNSSFLIHQIEKSDFRWSLRQILSIGNKLDFNFSKRSFESYMQQKKLSNTIFLDLRSIKISNKVKVKLSLQNGKQSMLDDSKIQCNYIWNFEIYPCITLSFLRHIYVSIKRSKEWLLPLISISTI